MDDLRTEIKNSIEKYHQDNFWTLFPAGVVREWVYDAVLENIVKPMKKEIDELKAVK